MIAFSDASTTSYINTVLHMPFSLTVNLCWLSLAVGDFIVVYVVRFRNADVAILQASLDKEELNIGSSI